MDENLQRAFLLEIRKQCTFALLAAEDLETYLRGGGDIERFWMSVQALLVAAGNVSKVFWPSRSGSKRVRVELRAEWRKQLRELLSVNELSPIHSRDIRDAFEHFDERLEEWVLEGHKFLVDSNVIPPGAIAGFDDKNYLRNFEPETYAVTFRGDRYELRPVIAELSELWGRAETEYRKSLNGGS